MLAGTKLHKTFGAALENAELGLTAKFADDLERHGADGACVAAARERGRNALRRYEN